MKDERKTKVQLIEELKSLRQRQAVLQSKESLTPDTAKDLRWERDMAKHYLDIAGVIILSLNNRGEITLINKKGCDILGWTERELIGKNWFDHFIPEKNREDIHDVFENLMAGAGKLVEYYINPVKTKDGKERIIAWYNTIKTDDHGQIIGVVSSGEDITEQKRAETALKESEERYKTLVQTSPDAVTVTNPVGLITYVSHQTLKLHGYDSSEELLGRSAIDLVAPKDRVKATLNMKRTLKEGVIRDEEYSLLKKDGSIFIGELSASVVRNIRGEPSMIIAATRDITERKVSEEALKNSIKEKEFLLQEIHHRVKNNLQVISSILDMTSMRIKDSACQNLIHDARAKIQTMTFIHSQLYRSDRFDRIDMSTHIKELLNYLASIFARDKKITSHVEIKDVHLPLTQAIPCSLVLTELISNAFKHAFKKGQRGTIEVSMNKTEGNRVFLRVRDDGIGMDTDIDIQDIKSLGLKLVRNLVMKQLKGQIQVKKNHYTEFQIVFFIPEEESLNATHNGSG